jgi:hypothetical protein
MQFSFKVVDARIDACHRSLKLVPLEAQKEKALTGLAFPRASNVELPGPAVRHPAEIPASTLTNKCVIRRRIDGLLQLGNFSSL